MLQDGIYYFGEHAFNSPQGIHVITNKQCITAIVFGLNIAMVIMFAAFHCGLQLILQRTTQVLTVVMISHMFLNLKASNSPAQQETESDDEAVGPQTKEKKLRQTSIAFEVQFTRPKKMSNIIGNLGNELVHTSVLDYWTVSEMVGIIYFGTT
jgi:hypothetical protein